MTNQNVSLTVFGDKQEHRRILSLTLPMVLANITSPLMGMVDTAVLGRLDGAFHLAGAAVAAFIITQVYWICGFLRMTSTGLSAQAKGAGDQQQGFRVFVQGSVLALLIAGLLLLLQLPLLAAGEYFSQPTKDMQHSLQTYFYVRIWGAPAALVNLVLVGWLIGQQCNRAVMWLQIAVNLLNAGLNVLLGLVLEYGVAGVAAASVIAEYTACAAGLWLVLVRTGVMPVPSGWLRLGAMSGLLSLNAEMFVRNLALQMCLAFVTFQGARYGALTAATNAILMNFFVLIALGLDAVAYAVESLVGEAKGEKNGVKIRLACYRGLFWSTLLAILYALVFWWFTPGIVALLTTQQNVIELVLTYAVVVVSMPLVCHWCFLMDGVFIGLTRARAMRNSMLISAFVVFLPCYVLLLPLQNVGLWIALFAFMLARAITLGGHFVWLDRRGELCG